MEDHGHESSADVAESIPLSKEHKSTFQTEISRLLQKKGTTFARIASEIGIEGTRAVRAGELLRRCVASERTLIGYDHHALSRALIAKYLSDSEEQYQRLLKCAHESRRAQRAKQRSVRHSPLRDERELYGLSPDAVQSKTGYSYDELLRIEQGKDTVTPEEEVQLVNAIRLVGEEKIRQVLESAYCSPSDVRSLVEDLVRKHACTGLGDHYVQFSEKLDGIGHELLKLIVRGEEMPGLPTLHRIISSGGEALTEEVVEDWSYEYAEQEYRKGNIPLARVLHVVCAEQYRSPYEFYGVHGLSMKKSLQRLKRGDVCAWKSIRKALVQLGVPEDSPRWLFVECVFREGDVRVALKLWYEEMCKRKESVDFSFKSLPGLTREESPKPVFDAVLGKFREQYVHLTPQDEDWIANIAIPLIIDGVSLEEVVQKIESELGAHLRVQEERALRRERLLAWVRMRDPHTVDASRIAFERATDDVLMEDLPEFTMRERLLSFLAVQRLMQKAKEIDGTTVHRALSAFEEAVKSLVESDASAEVCERVLQETVVLERIMQWAYLSDLDTVSGYYHVLKELAREALQGGRGEEDVRSLVEAKIVQLSGRKSV